MYQLDNTTPSATNGGTYLSGNAIHKVKFLGAEKADKGSFKVVSIKVEGLGDDAGCVYEDVIFEPKNEPRQTGGPNNYESPSSMEQFQAKLRQYIDALNPALSKAINENTKTLGAKDWEGMRDVIVAALNSKGNKNVGTETEYKLLKNKDGYATVPGFVAGLTKDGKVFQRTKFIGEGLSFTDYEMKQIDKAATAKPSNPESKNELNDELSGGAGADSSDDLDFDLEDL